MAAVGHTDSASGSIDRGRRANESLSGWAIARPAGRRDAGIANKGTDRTTGHRREIGLMGGSERISSS